jgi:type II secretory pathway component PulC
MNVEKELYMRHPLWLVDSTFLILFLAATAFAFFSLQKLPRRIKLESEASHTTEKKTVVPVDIAQIYENDLFNTYHKITPPPVQPNYTHAMPQPPTQTTVTIPAEPKQPFLAPLEIKLKGVATIDDDSDNIAMIADSKSTSQKNYKVGDMIEDARIIRILSNRAILIRSNGQQETLYLNEKDVETDPAFAEERDNWMHVVKKVGDEQFLLDPETLVLVSRNIAQFIDILDLTTVYKKGKSMGCRIGNITHDSLGSAMGLEPYDIVTHIDTVPTVNTEQRYKAYQEIIKKTFGNAVTIQLTRNGTPTTINYKLYDLKDPLDESLQELEKADKLAGIQIGPSAEVVEEERIKLLREKYKFAPTTQDIKVHQKMAMLQKGKREQVKSRQLTQ